MFPFSLLVDLVMLKKINCSRMEYTNDTLKKIVDINGDYLKKDYSLKIQFTILVLNL